ncbi:hypothetical protein, partial [Oceanobacillus oncorhynchi]|uniref:hypothetical protein n=1 Tax=Oceanobacillus oncorhynchi TaxID=545501 RepID=UPI002F965C45
AVTLHMTASVVTLTQLGGGKLRFLVRELSPSAPLSLNLPSNSCPLLRFSLFQAFYCIKKNTSSPS